MSETPIQASETNVDTQANRTDAVVVAAKGVLGAIPFIGSLVAEIIGTVIPNQRVDRIARLVEMLRQKVADLDHDKVAACLRSTEGVDLLEDGFWLAARALTDERIEHIANILKAGIGEDQARLGEKKRLMWLLGQLDDAEIILLTWFSQLDRDWAFEEKHRQTIEPRSCHSDLNDQEVDEVSIYLSRKQHLVNLGLTKPRFESVRRGELPEFDSNTGTMRSSGHEATPLGRLLVRTVTQGAYGNW